MARLMTPSNLLTVLRGYRDNMSEFDVEEMDYLILLVEKDTLEYPNRRII